MKKIKLAIPEVEQIEINGEVFDILKSPTEIMTRAAELDTQFAQIKAGEKTPENVECIRIWATGVVDFLDEILGDGAVKKISLGRPVKPEIAVEWLTAICETIAKEKYEKIESYISEKYE